MNATRHAIGLGLRRGWTEFVLSLRSPHDQGFNVLLAAAALGYLWFNRATEVDGTDLLLPSVALPSLLGGFLAFAVVIGPGFALAMDREDGTLLRHVALPHGMRGYVTGQVVYHSLGLLPLFGLILVPALLLFDDVMSGGAAGWITLIWVVVLGLAATLPIGMLLGSVVPDVQKVGSWGMLPLLAVTAISGIFTPVQSLWGWLQVVAQAFPTYWIGLGLRSAFLPDAAATVELGSAWRSGLTALVLGAWAIVGLVVTPAVLRRTARRQSGAKVQAARETAAQWVR